jgi:hypothetical protein
LGEPLSSHLPEEEVIETVILKKSDLETTREKLGFLKDKDSFEITN